MSTGTNQERLEQNNELLELNNSKLAEIKTIVENLPEAGGSEDLQEQLDNQDRIIAEMQEELRNKASGGGKPNIFVQEDEPETKDGIWFKTSEELKEIIEDNGVYISEQWNIDKMSSLRLIPYPFDGPVVAIGTDVYLFGSSFSSCRTYCYKYDTITDTYSRLTDIPYEFYYGSAVAIGTDVYLLGGYTTYGTYCYKYDTVTDTYEKLTNIPYPFDGGSVVVIGTDIYLLGSGTTQKKYCYKYDTVTDTYSELANIPYEFRAGAAVVIGTNIYLFGCYERAYQKYCYKYDTVTDTYSRLTDIPYEFYDGSAVAVGTDVYLFGNGNRAYRRYCYKYDTVTDVYSKLTDIPYEFYAGHANLVNAEIYLFGNRGDDNKQRVQVMTMFMTKEYTENSVVIANNEVNKYQTKLIPSNIINGLKYHFADTFFYKDGAFDTSIETYIGDGTEWIKIRGGAQ